MATEAGSFSLDHRSARHSKMGNAIRQRVFAQYNQENSHRARVGSPRPGIQADHFSTKGKQKAVSIQTEGESINQHIERSYYLNELNINEDAVLEAGTLPALVEWLTTENTESIDLRFRDVFLTTYPMFTSAATVVNLLVARYEMKRPYEKCELELNHWEDNQVQLVQIQVLAVLRCWVQDYHLLDSEPGEVSRICAFLSNIRGPEKTQSLAQSVLRIIDSKGWEKMPANLSLPLTSERPTSPDSLPCIVGFGVNELASQLTIMESEHYLRISSHDLIASVKESYPNSGLGIKSWPRSAGGLQKYARFNRSLTKAVICMVLEAETVAKRRNIVIHLINVTKELWTLRSFSSLHSIVLGLTSSKLKDLVSTWYTIADEKAWLDKILRLARGSSNKGAYHAEHMRAISDGTPCLPVIDNYLPSLKLLLSGREPEIDLLAQASTSTTTTSSPINFSRRRDIAEACHTGLQFQARKHIGMKENLGLRTWIERQLTLAAAASEGWYKERSKELKQSEGTHASIRYGLESAGF
ncbi:ras GEF [Clavulina sp. PMI_390]|nr:ras GEF [Clavulina sp. PMI_390]